MLWHSSWGSIVCMSMLTSASWPGDQRDGSTNSHVEPGPLHEGGSAIVMHDQHIMMSCKLHRQVHSSDSGRNARYILVSYSLMISAAELLSVSRRNHQRVAAAAIRPEVQLCNRPRFQWPACAGLLHLGMLTMEFPAVLCR